MHRVTAIPRGLRSQRNNINEAASLLTRAMTSSKFPTKDEIPNIPLDKPLDPDLAMPQVMGSKGRPKIGDCQVTTLSNGLRVASQVR